MNDEKLLESASQKGLEKCYQPYPKLQKPDTNLLRTLKIIRHCCFDTCFLCIPWPFSYFPREQTNLEGCLYRGSSKRSAIDSCFSVFCLVMVQAGTLEGTKEVQGLLEEQPKAVLAFWVLRSKLSNRKRYRNSMMHSLRHESIVVYDAAIGKKYTALTSHETHSRKRKNSVSKQS